MKHKWFLSRVSHSWIKMPHQQQCPQFYIHNSLVKDSIIALCIDMDRWCTTNLGASHPERWKIHSLQERKIKLTMPPLVFSILLLISLSPKGGGCLQLGFQVHLLIVTCKPKSVEEGEGQYIVLCSSAMHRSNQCTGLWTSYTTPSKCNHASNTM